MTKIIAEACCNHLGNAQIINSMIKQAKENGADIIKFQVYQTDGLNKNYPDYDFHKDYYKQHELTFAKIGAIKTVCDAEGIDVLFTAMDETSAKEIVHHCDEVKIGSAESTHLDFVEFCVKNFKKVYVSTGMIGNDLIKLVKILRPTDVVFYCVSDYPTKYETVDFDKMKMFDGFSDHTPDLRASKKAIDLGMSYIERHYTLGKYLPGKDHKISSTPDELKQLVDYRNFINNKDFYKGRWINV